MRTGALPVTGWGLGVVAVAVFGTLAYGLDTLPTLLLAGSGAGAVAIGLWAGWSGRREARAAGPRRSEALPDLSMPTVAATAGLTVALVGLGGGGGTFLWPGLGLFALALAGLARDLVLARRLRGRVERALRTQEEVPPGAPPAGEPSLRDALGGEGGR